MIVGRMSLNGARSIQHTARVTEPRGADAPRSTCVASRVRVISRAWRLPALGCGHLPLHVGECYPTTGGSRPPLLAIVGRMRERLCIVQKSHILAKATFAVHERSRIQTGAAGVSPPWCAETHLQGRYRKRAGDCRRWAGERHRNRGRRGSVGSVPSDWAVALRMRFGEPRGANAPRSCCTNAFLLEISVSATRALPGHGGLTPPALVLSVACR
jgi:hypothetical protein